MTGKIFEMSKHGLIRQGDVLLVPVRSVPKNCRELESDVVHHGEGSHTHRLVGSAKIMESLDPTKDIYIVVPPETLNNLQKSTLTHEEHDHIVLAPGAYKKVIQREYDTMSSMREHQPITRDVWD